MLVNLSPAQNPDESKSLLAAVTQATLERQNATKTVRFDWTEKTLSTKGSISLMFSGIVPSDKKEAPPSDVRFDGHGWLSIDGEKVRLHKETKVWDTKEEGYFPKTFDSYYDGEICTVLNNYDENVQSHPGATVGKSNRNLRVEVSQLPLIIHYRGLSEDMNNRDSLAMYTSARRAILDGRSVIELARNRTEIRGESKSWFDPEKGYLMVRRDNYDRNGNLSVRIVVKPSRPSGEWVPSEWTTLIYMKKKLVSTIQTKMTSLAVNDASAVADPHIRFPAGTWVTEDLGETKKDYLVKKDGEIRVVSREEFSIPYDQLMNSMPKKSTSEAKSSLVVTLVIITLMSTTFFVGFYLFLRRYRNRKSNSAGLND